MKKNNGRRKGRGIEGGRRNEVEGGREGRKEAGYEER